MYLQRYHDVPVSTSGVWRILKRLGLNRLSASQRYKRHDRRWKRYESRARATSCRSMSSSSSRSASPVAGASTTNSPRSTTAPGCGSCAPTRAATRRPRSSSSTTPWPAALRRRARADGQRPGVRCIVPLAPAGQGHRPCLYQPRTPRLNGKVERSHRIDAEEFYRLLEGQVIDDTRLFTEKLQEWEDYYNCHRAHGASAAKPLRTPAAESPRPAVIGLRQLHT
jgi:hypothetical protein